MSWSQIESMDLLTPLLCMAVSNNVNVLSLWLHYLMKFTHRIFFPSYYYKMEVFFFGQFIKWKLLSAFYLVNCFVEPACLSTNKIMYPHNIYIYILYIESVVIVWWDIFFNFFITSLLINCEQRIMAFYKGDKWQL